MKITLAGLAYMYEGGDSRLRLVVSNPDPLDRLSAIQRFIIDTTMGDWAEQYRKGLARIDLARTAPGAIPSWGKWSNSEWVNYDVLTHRHEIFDRPGEIHIGMLPHLALPPGWYRTISCEAEREALCKYGYWKTETKWIPPQIIDGSGSFVRRLDRP